MTYSGSNNSGGNTEPKTGEQYTPLCRKSGFKQTESAMSSKMSSQHQHTDKHYQYEDAGSGTGGNVHGWSPE